MRTAKGFTLIEILVVMVIIGIVASIAVLATGDFGRKRQVDELSLELQSVCTLLQTRAILTGNIIGIRFHPHSYDFLVFDRQTQEWNALPFNQSIRTQPLPPDVEFHVLNQESQQNKKTPDVTLLPGGEISPLTVAIEYHHHAVHYLKVSHDQFEITQSAA